MGVLGEGGRQAVPEGPVVEGVPLVVVLDHAAGVELPGVADGGAATSGQTLHQQPVDQLRAEEHVMEQPLLHSVDGTRNTSMSWNNLCCTLPTGEATA